MNQGRGGSPVGVWSHFMRPLRSVWMSCLLLAGMGIQDPLQSHAAGVRFEATTNGGFVFDTGLVRGNLREGGKSKGLSQVIHVPTGTRVDASMGLFSHYRLFTKNHRYGVGAWDLPSDAVLQADGSVKVTWPATDQMPFTLGAVYRWVGPATMDLETTVTARTRLEQFESFMASYFAPAFTNSLVWSKGEPAWMPAKQADGVWMTFGRDSGVWGMIRDGRWKIEPNPVDWVERPAYHAPVGLRRAPGAGVMAAIMAPPEDCFAVSTPHDQEPHYSMYLSLFGRDVEPGQTLTARSRLCLLPTGNERLLEPMYNEFKGRTLPRR